MMGELNFFLGLQIKQMEDGIFFNQSKYIKEMLKKFGLEDSKPTNTPMSTEIKLTEDDEPDSTDSSKYQGKLKTRWSGPFTITHFFPYGTVELSQPNGPNFKVNGHRVKHYFGGDIPSKDLPHND
nr:reverse transcriptase domain-containing protein [Tanacetum cinerariifolium]